MRPPTCSSRRDGVATRLFTRDVLSGGDVARLVAVALPPADDGSALSALVDELPSEERALALALAPARRATWAGGRVALRAALADLGVGAAAPIGATPRGAPALPAGLAGSIGHKESVAVALAA